MTTKTAATKQSEARSAGWERAKSVGVRAALAISVALWIGSMFCSMEVGVTRERVLNGFGDGSPNRTESFNLIGARGGVLCCFSTCDDMRGMHPEFPDENTPVGKSRWTYYQHAGTSNVRYPKSGKEPLFLGCSAGRYDSTHDPAADRLVYYSEWTLVFPMAAPTALLAAAAALQVWRTASSVRRRRIQLVQCESCGYDLRATPMRCPECGLTAARSLGNFGSKSSSPVVDDPSKLDGPIANDVLNPSNESLYY